MIKTGEIAAIAGYHKQYTIAAWEIYSAIVDNSLQWIEIASLEAGNLDDVLLGFQDRILACQVKDRSDTFTYQTLVNKDNGLIKRMFDGWSKLREKYPPAIKHSFN